MGEPEQPEYSHINPSHLLGTSSGALANQGTIGHTKEEALFFTLGMNFLSKGMKEHEYEGKVKDFCQQLLTLFNGEEIPNIAEDWSEGDKQVTFTYDFPPDGDAKRHIHLLVSSLFLTNPYFANQRTYYVLNDGLQNTKRTHELRDAWGKNNTEELIQAPHALSLASFTTETRELDEEIIEGKTVVGGSFIVDDVALLGREERVFAEEASLREDFGDSTLDQYVLDLLHSGRNIRDEYEAELSSAYTKPWKRAVLSSLIAYETSDEKEFHRMIRRKMGHIVQIADSIHDNYKIILQRDIIESQDELYDVAWYTFDYRLIELVQQTYPAGADIPYPPKIDNEHGELYKDAFHDALCGAAECDLNPSFIESLRTTETNAIEWSSDLFNNGDEAVDRLMIELVRGDPDFGLAMQHEKLTQHPMFGYTDEELQDYMEIEESVLLSCCAAWLYVFNATNFIEFSARLDDCVDLFTDVHNEGDGVEEILDKTYLSVSFAKSFAKIEMTAMEAVIRHRQDTIEYMITSTHNTNQQLMESYKEEYAFYISALNLVSDDKHDEDIYKLHDAYVDLIDAYAPEEDDTSNDNDDYAEVD